MNSLSLTARIGMLFAMAAAAVLLATGFFLSRAVEAHFIESDRHELDGKLELIRRLIERGDGQANQDRLPKQLDDALVGHHGLSVAVADVGGAVWFATPGADFSSALMQAKDCQATLSAAHCLSGGLWQWRQGEHAYRGKVVSMATATGETQRVAVALDIGHHELFMARFRLILVIAMTLAALTTAGLGWFAAHRSLASLRRFSDLAAGISAEHLKARLPEGGHPPEILNLAHSFNAMLDRLEDAFRRLSEFSSDIAHELRTPVSNLMTLTQVALGRQRTTAEYREVLQSSMEEYERLARMTEEMLFLAKADNRLIEPKRESVDLVREVLDLMEFHGLVAEERGVRLELDGAATVKGDRLMLRRALSNLLSNAIRHCPVGETVVVRLGVNYGKAVISVENPGTIPPKNLPRLFDRFYTGDPSRHSGGGGTGLGLAIVRSIVEAHGGTITASSKAGSTRFEFHLPDFPLFMSGSKVIASRTVKDGHFGSQKAPGGAH